MYYTEGDYSVAIGYWNTKLPANECPRRNLPGNITFTLSHLGWTTFLHAVSISALMMNFCGPPLNSLQYAYYLTFPREPQIAHKSAGTSAKQRGSITFLTCYLQPD